MSTVEATSLTIQPNVYYTTDEAARLLRVSHESVLRLLRAERLEGVRIGRQWRILGASLLNLAPRARKGEAALVADWLAASSRSLAEVWDNADDAAYDNL